MKRIRDTFFGRGGSAARDVVRMVFGTASAQLIGMIALVPLARMYTPEAFGFFALFQSVVSLGQTLASLRYDLAIVLPKDDDDARVLRQLSLYSIVVVSLMVTVGLVLARSWLAREYDDDAFANWMVAAGAAIFVASQTSNIQYWLTRKKQFGVIASNRVFQATVIALAQLAAYFVLPNIGGLVIGFICGGTVTLAALVIRTPSLRTAIGTDAPTKWDMAKRYKKMPLLNGPNAVIDSVRNMGISFLIGQIAISDLGEYNMAWRLTMAPASLIQGAIAQVFLQRMATAVPGELCSLLKKAMLRIAAIAVPAFSCYYVLAPFLFRTFLGAEWGQSGELARALMPWVFMLTFSGPSSNVFIVAEKQQWLLLFALIYTAPPLLLLSLTELPLLTTVRALSWLMAALLAIMLAMTWAAARAFDHGR